MRAGVVLILIVALSGLAACGQSASTTSPSPTSTPTAGSPLEGSWTPEHGAVAFSSGEMPYTYQRSATAGGGVIVEAAQNGYAVTLVSSNGERRTATKASMQGGVLLVDVDAGQMSLGQESANRVQMLWTENGIPAPGSGVYLKRGTLPSP